MTITDFLEARIAEDENRARNAPKMSDLYSAQDMALTPAFRQRMLAESAAKRAVIKSYRSCRQAEAGTDIVRELGAKLTVSGMATGLEIALKSLAAVYAAHPDYQPEWAK